MHIRGSTFEMYAVLLLGSLIRLKKSDVIRANIFMFAIIESITDLELGQWWLDG